MTKTEAMTRFNLRDGQFFAFYTYKNLQWFLNGAYIGFGDLRDDDVLNIALLLEDGETFVGYNEHHGSRWQQTNTPMIRISNQDIKFREEIIQKEGK